MNKYQLECIEKARLIIESLPKSRYYKAPIKKSNILVPIYISQMHMSQMNAIQPIIYTISFGSNMPNLSNSIDMDE